jgi:predicted phosphate transport protein (TIGR00153 family)
MAFSLLPREDAYFALFSQISTKITEAADLLVEMMKSDATQFEAYAKKIKDVEHACDDLTHSVTTKLNKSFITPFDREDIYTLAVALDDIVDYIDAAARAMLMYDIKETTEHARRFSIVIQSLSLEIHEMVGTLSKPHNITSHLVEIHKLENEADDIYFQAVGGLFHQTNEPATIIKWKELYELLEYATDRCESVANISESIILKHT